MSVTVAELIAIPRLQLSLLSGAGGQDRLVTWAHPSDLNHPWDWLTGGELVLRNGETLPVAADEQLGYLRRLAETGAAGLVVGADPRTPRLHPEVVAAADELGFPLLRVPYAVGFATLARAVADANSREDAARLARAERIYQVVRDSLAGRTRRGLLALLERELRCRLLLVDGGGDPVPPDGGTERVYSGGTPQRLTGDGERAAGDAERGRRDGRRGTGDGARGTGGGPEARDGKSLSPALRAAIKAAVAQAGGAIPGVLRVDTRGEVAEGLASFVVEVPAAEPTLLVLLGAQPGWVDAALVQHVATAAAVEVAAWSMRQGHERRRGGELLSQLLDDQLAPGPADALFAATGLDPAESVLLAVRDGLPEGERDLHLGLTRRGLPYLLLRRGEVLYAVLPDRPAALELLAARLGHRAGIGVSAVLGGPRRLPAARREADWALSVARSMPEPIPDRATSGRSAGPPAAARTARYGDQVSLALLRDLDEARVVVERTLGPLLRYDHEHGSDLVGSLLAFLAHRRSWQRTARALGVHKQTVFYRMSRVEQLTGRDLAETGDLAELWVALRAMTLLSGAAG